MKIGLLYDRFGVEEQFFLKREYNIEKINSNDIIIEGKPFDNFDIIINRIESKYRRKKLAKFYEIYGTEMINNYSIEEICGSKIETKLALAMKNVPVAEAAFKFGFPFKKMDGDVIKQSTEVNRLKKIIKRLKPCISKPDMGSRGKSIILIKDEKAFTEIIDKYKNFKDIPETFKSNLISPEGVLIEKFSPHALDLRVVIYKLKGGAEKVFGTLVRAVPDDSILAKNTSLGGVPIGVPNMDLVEKLAINSMEAIESYANKIYQKKIDYYIVGVDILPVNNDMDERMKVYSAIVKLSKYMNKINQAKRIKKENIIENAFKEFKESDEYKEAQQICLDYIFKSNLIVTEINSTPDFGINTKNLVGNLIICYDKIIESLIN